MWFSGSTDDFHLIDSLYHLNLIDRWMINELENFADNNFNHLLHVFTQNYLSHQKIK